jgi:hypothetical protein
MAKKVAEIWDELEGAKAELKEDVDIKIGEKEVTLEVKLVELDEIQEINKYYDEGNYIKKPKIQVPTNEGKKNIEVPTDEQKYQRFNTHKKAKEWAKKINKQRNYHMAYEFLADEYKPADNVEDGIEMLKERLRYSDIINIVQTGFDINGFGKQLGKQNQDS